MWSRSTHRPVKAIQLNGLSLLSQGIENYGHKVCFPSYALASYCHETI